MWNGDKQIQKAGDNASQIQVAGNLVVGLTAAEVRQIALDVFKANFLDLSIGAKQKADERVAEITDKVIERLYSIVPDRVYKIEDPEIQSSLFNVQKEYARLGDIETGENLILALIDKIKIDEQNSESFVVDDALQILPKISKANLASLGIMVFSKVALPINSREHFEQMLHELSPVLKDMVLVSNLDMGYLIQLGCVYRTVNNDVNKSLETQLIKNYEYFYSKLIDVNKFNKLIFKYTNNDDTKMRLLAPLFDMRDRQIVGLVFPNRSRYHEATETYPDIFQDWMKSFCEEYFTLQENITDEVVHTFHQQLDTNWEAVFEIMKSEHVKSFNLNPVGYYIGALYLSKYIDIKIPLDLFYPR